jgi:membrane protein YqaA with SNARE-associated domain
LVSGNGRASKKYLTAHLLKAVLSGITCPGKHSHTAVVRFLRFDHIKQIRTWGGVLIVFAALFPLPFSPVCMAAGMIRFPLPAFFLLGLFRFARFFGYALILYKVV